MFLKQAIKFLSAKKIITPFVNLMYPPVCLHCHASLIDSNFLFCEACQFLLDFIDPIGRCSFCFSSHLSDGKKICLSCMSYPSVFQGVAAIFDYAGPAGSLVRTLKYGGRSYLSTGMGAYLAAQFIRLDWPIPDYVIPVPLTLTRLWQRGYNQSMLLSEELGRILGRPVRQALKRKLGGFSQAGLTKAQRLQLDEGQFCLLPGQQLQDKCILLIDDVMTTGTTLKRCAHALLPEGPSHIYAMAFCKTME